MAKTFETEGFAELQKQLEHLQTKDPRMRENIRVAIRRVLAQVKKAMSSSAREGLQMKSDPRNAYKAVRYAVYKRLLGGQVNILARRKAGKPTTYQKQKKGLPKRGGNRWGRSDRTVSLESYEGADRGFILRFLNAGTDDRAIRSYTDKGGDRRDLRSGGIQDRKTRALGGNRGSIAGRNWFGPRSQKELEAASYNLQNMIDDIINDIFM